MHHGAASGRPRGRPRPRDGGARRGGRRRGSASRRARRVPRGRPPRPVGRELRRTREGPRGRARRPPGGEADEALKRKDVPAARRAAVSILEIDPHAAAGYRALAKAAEAEGALEDAWSAARSAHEIDPADPALIESLALLATKTGRWAEAESLYTELGKTDPAFREKAATAGVEFRVQNLPAPARRAAFSPRLTRAQLAALLVELSPEVREARMAPGADVAVDVVDRPERAALVRTIALGFFPVSRDSHVVGADVPVSRTEMASHLRRLAALAGGELTCAASLAECGILPEGSRQVSGREAVAAIDATLRMARSGGSR